MKIRDYLKRTKAEKKLFQAQMDPDLYQRLTAMLKKERIKRSDFLEAAAKAFLNDSQ